MTQATRDALERVSQILHEAGWDTLRPAKPEVTENGIRAMRDAYAQLLRDDHLSILNDTPGKGLRVEDAGQAGGMGRWLDVVYMQLLLQ